MNATASEPLPALDSSVAVYRTARKPWRCTCADRVGSYRVYWEREEDWGTSHGYRSGPWGRTPAGAAQMAKEMRDSGAYTLVEVRERLNRNYPSKAAGCRGDIHPGDRYIEYLGDAGAYQSGERYCLPCGISTWSIPR
jgi:hypothetical protein